MQKELSKKTCPPTQYRYPAVRLPVYHGVPEFFGGGGGDSEQRPRRLETVANCVGGPVPAATIFIP